MSSSFGAFEPIKLELGKPALSCGPVHDLELGRITGRDPQQPVAPCRLVDFLLQPVDALDTSDYYRLIVERHRRARRRESRPGQRSDGVPERLKERVPIHSEREPRFW